MLSTDGVQPKNRAMTITTRIWGTALTAAMNMLETGNISRGR